MKKNRLFIVLTALLLPLLAAPAHAQAPAAQVPTLSHTYEIAGFSVRTPFELDQIVTPNFFQQPDWRHIEDILYKSCQDFSVIGWTGTGETGEPVRRALGIQVPYVKYQPHSNLITLEAFAESLMETFPYETFAKSAVQKGGAEGIEYRGEITRQGRGPRQQTSAATPSTKVRLMVFRRGTEVWGVMYTNNDPSLDTLLDEMFETISFR